jgi:hypothetical protein
MSIVREQCKYAKNSKQDKVQFALCRKCWLMAKYALGFSLPLNHKKGKLNVMAEVLILYIIQLLQ